MAFYLLSEVVNRHGKELDKEATSANPNKRIRAALVLAR
jgi:hypothetical protein